MVPNQHKMRVMEAVADRNLASVMNDTKWRELQDAVLNELLFPPPYQIKYVMEDQLYPEEFESDVWYWGDWIEGIDPFYNVEWIRVRPRYLKHRGRLVSPEVVDIADDFGKILKELSIPYRLDQDTYTIYGYISEMSLLTK
ncbi:hypothetical protein NCCP2222_04240 [Sporosarcina sp. NCCP-2222]|uniref:DUF6678 family protein n=1 Tax=Sporosarcina sp. NCCP-2222 TaxID=2935073 RepID=UPI00208054AC|nr:DUF6678 family protein [Sporosarcina sp. NCCP-2222]GKV54477.1 hypothetical protein NCCP2222_04240 [Sporosarcina sp. NCCP-2222]